MSIFIRYSICAINLTLSKKYMNMKHLEAALEDVSIAG